MAEVEILKATVTGWEVLQDAVKIGLGGLIAGSFTYINSKGSSKKELDKELRANKVKILQDSNVLVSEYYNAFERLIGHIDGAIAADYSDSDWKDYLAEHFNENSPSGLWQAEERMLLAIDGKSIATTNMYLLGLDDMAKKFDHLDKWEDTFRVDVIINENLITKGEIDQLKLKLKTEKAKFYKSLNKIFMKIHK